jgi:TatD DNase family protein
MIDIGANLTNKRFASDLEAVLARAAAAGVSKIVATGTSLEGSHLAHELTQAHPGAIYSTAGIHPHSATACDADALAQLAVLCAQREVVAVGECGLDYNRNYSPPADQRRAFVEQVGLAIELGLPLFLHEREAHADLIAILKEHRAEFSRAVVHCFTGTGAELDAYIELDLHLGITGWICDERRGLHLRDVVGRIPVDRLMIETDAPYLLPRTIRPKPKSNRNEPSFLSYVVQDLSESVGRSVGTVAEQTAATAEAFFGI